MTVKPRPVGSVSVSEISGTSAKVSWQTNSEPVDQYKVILTDSITGAQRTLTVPGDENTKTIRSLKPNQLYTVMVKAIKDGISETRTDREIFKTQGIGALVKPKSLFIITYKRPLICCMHLL